MKKTRLITVLSFILSASLSFSSFAVIQSPPKDKDVFSDVYISDEKPDTDGVISRGEYKKMTVPQSSLSYITGSEADWLRAKNTEFEAYGAVYDGTFYFALSTPLDEEYYITECEPKYMWAQTALLLSFAKTGTQGRAALEFGIRADGAFHVWRLYNGVEYTPENNFAAVYKDGVITYEAAVPLSAFGAENDDSFLFCFSISSGDYFNGERQVYVQFGRGISGFSEPSDADAGKNAALCPVINILEEGDEPTTRPVSDETEAPDTGIDVKAVVILSAASASASLAAMILIKKKRLVSAVYIRSI